MSKKINPNRKPATAADINRARKEAINYALRAMLAISLTTMCDTFGFGDIRLKRFQEHSEKLVEEINEGRISIDDLIKVLADEHDIKITL